MNSLTITGNNYVGAMVAENAAKFNNDQRAVYNAVMESVNNNTPEVFFLHSAGGCGKIFEARQLQLWHFNFSIATFSTLPSPHIPSRSKWILAIQVDPTKF